MYSDKDMKRVLSRNLNSEFDVIKFYLANMKKLNYAKNKVKVDTLIFESFEHAQLISRELLALDAKASGKLDKKSQVEALREETGVKEVYQYESNRTSVKRVKDLLDYLVKEETDHEKLVKILK